MHELNNSSEQKFKRVQKSFANATSLLKKMQTDLWFIHGAIKKIDATGVIQKAAVVSMILRALVII